MKILSPLKKAIKRIIKKFGYTIHKKNEYKDKWVNVTNAIEHNSQTQIDNFFKDDSLLTNYINEERIEFYREVAGLAKEKIFSPGQTVVDAGCGTGHLLYYLKEKLGFQKATGLDFSPEAIKIAKKLFPFFDFYEFDIYKGWNGKFDLVFCTEVLEHLLYPEEALVNLIAMMNENRKILITVPNGRNDTFGGHINFWSPESWEVFIKKNTQGLYTETGSLQNKNVNYAIIKKS